MKTIVCGLFLTLTACSVWANDLWGGFGGPRGWAMQGVPRDRAVLILPQQANPMRIAPILPMEPMGRTVINPYGVRPGQPGFRYELEEDE